VTLRVENAVSYQNYYAALTTYATTNRWGQMTPTYHRRQHMLINK